MLMNYVELKQGVPVRMHFTDDYFIARTIYDKHLDKQKPLWVLTFWVDRLDGQPAARTFSATSQKLSKLFEPDLPDKAYRNYEYTVTKHGELYTTEYTVERRPYSG